MICLETTSRCKFKYIFMILAIESICSHFLVNCFPFTVNELNLLISIINRIRFYHLWQKIKQIIVTKTGYNLISISHKVSLEGDSIETFKPQKPKHLAVLRPAFSLVACSSSCYTTTARAPAIYIFISGSEVEGKKRRIQQFPCRKLPKNPHTTFLQPSHWLELSHIIISSCKWSGGTAVFP